MQALQVFYISTLFYATLINANGGYFGYLPEEQSQWAAHYPQCGQERQSPIVIDTKKTLEADIGPIYYNKYNRNLLGPYIKNKGYTVAVLFEDELPCGSVPSLQADFFKGRYCFKELHLHWGPVDYKGSEHIVDRKKTALEVHLVHEMGDHFVVLAILYKIGNENVALKNVTASLHLVKNKGTMVSMKRKVNLHWILDGINRAHFLHYEGSLTTPPCSENVLWIIYKDILTVSSAQVQALRELNTVDKDGNLKKLTSNHRLPMPLNRRSVISSKGKDTKSFARSYRSGFLTYMTTAAWTLVW